MRALFLVTHYVLRFTFYVIPRNLEDPGLFDPLILPIRVHRSFMTQCAKSLGKTKRMAKIQPL
jgi:hypothetical protein